jgi:8-oxo-dGTP pyrophosphatase MutT (NUDIX family)
MENKRFGLGVFTCVFNLDFSKILLVKRNKEKREKYDANWGNIGGRIEFGEYAIDAAIREIKEELCVKIDKKNIRFIKMVEYPDWLKKNNVHGIQFIFATTIDENTKICINSEADKFEWFFLDNLPNKMIDTKKEIAKLRIIAQELFK